MRFRKLRIAWSVMCGIACVLSIALWVRSYYSFDYFLAFHPSVKQFFFWETSGQCGVTIIDAPVVLRDVEVRHELPKEPWQFETGQLTEPDPFPDKSAPSCMGFRCVLMTSDLSAISAPFWSLVFLAATLSAAPWIRWPRRFTLRTLLIATTLVAVVLGLIVWMSSAG